jgi:membrane fusion protein (multidrug efflux system)
MKLDASNEGHPRVEGATRMRMLLPAAAILLGLLLVGMYLRAASKENHIALIASAKPVSVARAAASTYRARRIYVGTSQAWALARVGPQHISAYLGTVLVRPGAVVKRGEVLATLDCRSSSAASRAIAARARALEERRNAIAHESERVKQMTAGGFASENEVEQLTSRSAAETAEVESLRESLLSKSLEVDDCILRAPFNGEVTERLADPGSYVRPGQAVITLVDRSTVRVTADVPEEDFEIVAPGVEVGLAGAAGAAATAKISRRAPAADEATRTIHFEVDVPNTDRKLPVGTTVSVSIDVGTPRPATTVPLRSATVRGDQATVFVVRDHVAHRTTVSLLGEAEGRLYLDPQLVSDSLVVVEGRALLDDGDRVNEREQQK